MVATINNDDMTVDFTWEYDDSTNDIPSSNFSVRIKRNEQIILSDDISINSRSYTIPLSNLESGEVYSVEVVVRNIHGDSDPVSQIFTVPVRGESLTLDGKFFIDYKCSITIGTHFCLLWLLHILYVIDYFVIRSYVAFCG